LPAPEIEDLSRLLSPGDGLTNQIDCEIDPTLVKLTVYVQLYGIWIRGCVFIAGTQLVRREKDAEPFGMPRKSMVSIEMVPLNQIATV